MGEYHQSDIRPIAEPLYVVITEVNGSWPCNDVKYQKVLDHLTRTIGSKVVRRAWRIHQRVKTFFEFIQAVGNGLVYLCIETWA